jgi:hypothetical protein
VVLQAPARQAPVKAYVEQVETTLFLWVLKCETVFSKGAARQYATGELTFSVLALALVQRRDCIHSG